MTGTAGQHTFIFADLAGYTALTEAHGEEYAADAAAEFVRAARPLIAAHGAEEVKALGDALLIRSSDARDAVRLARELVCELGRRERALGTRVAMHTGTAVERDGDWFGSAVNVAARVADGAKAGEVLLTAATWSAAGEGLQVRARGARRFRNVAEPVELYVLDLDGHLPMGRVVDPVCRMMLDQTGVEHHLPCRSWPGRPAWQTPGRSGLCVHGLARRVRHRCLRDGLR